MSAQVTSLLSEGIEIARGELRAETEWPSAPAGLAYRLLAAAGLDRPDYMSFPLPAPSPESLRRTPVLAGYGYLIASAGTDVEQHWYHAFERLRGREVFPADRDSFIFNPIELLGIAVGVTDAPTTHENERAWLSETLQRGLRENKFRTPVLGVAALAALRHVDAIAAAGRSADLAVDQLSPADLVLVRGLALAFPAAWGPGIDQLEGALARRALSERLTMSGPAEAATMLVTLQRVLDQLAMAATPASSADRVLALCRRFPLFARQLETRHGGRSPMPIKDEYDVQDLMHAILRLHFDDIRPEEVTPSYAGNSSRVDFWLPREGIVVETKMTRKGLGQKEVADELTIDAARYATATNAQLLICMVYDPAGLCRTADALENDIRQSGPNLQVKVVVCPKGL